MEDTLSSSGPIDLDAPDDYLMFDHAPDDRMDHSDMDGYSTRTSPLRQLEQRGSK
jgi:hypothetical protein